MAYEDRVGADKVPGSPSLADRLHNTSAAWIVLAASVSLTLAGWYIADSYVYERARVEYQALAIDARERIEERVADYTFTLRAGLSFIDTLQRLPMREEWRHFVDGLDIAARFPGIQGFGLALMLEPEELAGHEAQVREEGFPDYRVRPAGDRDLYSAIVYLEPFDWRNQRAFGYDMYSNPVRREAMDRAARSGEPAASGRVTLVQETAADPQAGFLIYLPVYAPGGGETDRDDPLGYVYSAFRMGDLMVGTLGSGTGAIAFRLYDGAHETADALLFDGADSLAAGYTPPFTSTAGIDAAGREWTVRFLSLPRFEEKLSTAQPAFIATAAFAVDILLFLVLLSSAIQRRRVEEHALDTARLLTSTNDRLRRIQEIAGFAAWEMDLERQRLVGDQQLLERYGFAPGDTVEHLADWSARLHPQDRDRTLKAAERAFRDRSIYHNRFRVILPEGEERVMESTGFPVANASDSGWSLSGIERDITDEAHREEQVALHASVFDSAREAILITTPDARILAVNGAFTKVTGYSAEEVVGRNPSLLHSGEHDRDFYRVFWEALTSRGHWDGEICNRRRDGSLVHGQLSVAAVKKPDMSLSHYVGLFTDISKQKAQEIALQRLASFDPLTELPNRVLLSDRLERAMALARRSGLQLAICYLDLDGFKDVNDRLGHDAGDTLLVLAAARLRKLLRGCDTASRLGGDEFLLLVSELEDTQACQPFLQRILQALSAPYLIQGHFTEVSASIGVTLFPADDTDADTLIRHADQAMYRAKEAGRNRFELFDLNLAERSRDYQAHVAAVGNGLAAEEFLLHYQPKVDMRSGVVIGAEALLRWQHPDEGLLYPAAFIQYLDDPLHFLSFGRWVLRTALSQLRAWHSEGLDIALSVNISGSHLQEGDFVTELRSLLRQYPDIRPQCLELEVLETSALEDIERVSRALAACRDLGVRISIDDFGTGYSSLVYLRELTADVVKIDQTFVRGMLASEEDRAIVEGVVRLAQVFHRDVIAEGVETEKHGLELLRMGCHLGQGWGIAKAMPAAELPGWISRYEMPDSWREVDARNE